jgi:hypothetical protein
LTGITSVSGNASPKGYGKVRVSRILPAVISEQDPDTSRNPDEDGPVAGKFPARMQSPGKNCRKNFYKKIRNEEKSVMKKNLQ